jgi:hypothetical protein
MLPMAWSAKRLSRFKLMGPPEGYEIRPLCASRRDFENTPVPARLTAIDAKTLSFFNTSGACSIDFCQFAPMFRLNAALDRNAIPKGLPLVSVTHGP